MDEIIQVEKINEVYFRLKNISISTALELKDWFSVKATNFFFHPKYKAGHWDGNITFFNYANHTIPIGLWPKFVDFCNNYHYQYIKEFETSDLLNNITDDEVEKFYEVIFKDSAYSPRDYQHESIMKALNYKRGIIESPTASGKSLVLYCIIRFLLGTCEGKILLIVPNIGLVNQMFADFVDYGWTDCESYTSKIFHGSKFINWDRPVIISTYQSIYKNSLEFFSQFQAVLVDETHQSKCLSIKSCLEKSINAEYRVGLTGTLPDEKDYRMTIFGYLGPKMFSLKSSDLIKKGVLSKIKIANILMKYDEKVIYKYWHNENDNIQKQEYNDELNIIYNTDKRNGVFKYILNHIDSKDNILILCHKIDHLKSLKKYCEENFQNRKVHEIYGLTDANDRESIRLLADKSDSMIIIGTYATFGVGINIKKLHHVIFASSFRSKTKILQAIGRGLRTHESKSQVIIWDLIDDLTFINNWHGEDVIHKNFTYDHWEKRLEYYDNQGFEYFNKKINIRDL